jgi:hypothetical protein
MDLVYGLAMLVCVALIFALARGCQRLAARGQGRRV